MASTKRQNLPRGLWIIATPIGNLADLSPRALQAISEASALLCEDTRRTSHLISAMGLDGIRLERLDQHAPEARLAGIVKRLNDGENLGLVCDAGTPGMSDPGAKLVAMAVEAGIAVTPLPGPSAVSTLFSIAGIEEVPFVFRGFFPRSKSEQLKELQLAQKSHVANSFIWFESPMRVDKSLALLGKTCPTATVVAAKEMTKLHERYFRGTAADVAQQVKEDISQNGSKGEWAFFANFAHHFSGDKNSENVQNLNEVSESAGWEKALSCLLDADVGPSSSSKLVSQYFGVKKNSVYQQALEIQKKKSKKSSLGD